MNNDNIAILDIGTTKVVAMVGRKNEDDKVQILGFAEAKAKGMDKGLVQNILEASEVIRKVTNDVKNQTGIDFKDVYVGIAGQYIESRQTNHSIMNESGDMITEELVKRLITDVYNISLETGKKVLHVFPQSYVVNGQKVKSPVGMLGKQVNGTFHISIANAQSLEILYRTIEKANLNIKHIILEPVASAEAVLDKDEKKAGTALIDIGGGTSDLIIYKDNTIKHTAVIPFGGNTITFDISEGCKITLDFAEELKIEHGHALEEATTENNKISIPGLSGREGYTVSEKFIAQIIQVRLLEIVDTIGNEIQKSGLFDSINAITLTGGGSLLKEIDKFFEFRLGKGVRIGRPQNYIFANEKILDNPKYATAVGLLQKAFFYIERDKLKLQQQDQHQETKEETDNHDDTNVENKQEKKKEGLWQRIKRQLLAIIFDNSETIDD